jgi:hypothetical protein
MNTNTPINSPYLQTSRNFPREIDQLSIELNNSYTDIAIAVNNRTISTFISNKSVLTGENSYVVKNRKQQTLRQVYPFTSAALTIPHMIDVTKIAGFTNIYGTFTNGTNWYPLPYVDVVSSTNQVNVIVTPTNIVITSGAGAPPVIVSGYVVLEWLSNV